MKKHLFLILVSLTISTVSFSQKKTSDDSVPNKFILPVNNYTKIKTCCIDDYNNISLFGNPVENELQITCDSSSFSIASFDGEIHKIIKLGETYSVFLINQHFTLIYSNLKEVYVKEKEKIAKGIKIGKVAIVNNKTILKIEIWRNGEKLNPETYFDFN